MYIVIKSVGVPITWISTAHASPYESASPNPSSYVSMSFWIVWGIAAVDDEFFWKMATPAALLSARFD